MATQDAGREGGAFAPVRIDRSHTIELDGPAQEVIHLFTPIGEKEWVPDWEPEVLYEGDGTPVAGGVFTTRGKDGETIWTVIEFDPSRGVARYARVTPGMRAGEVEVVCRPRSAERSTATIRYRLTGLSMDGNRALEEWTPEWYATFIAGWEREVNAALERR